MGFVGNRGNLLARITNADRHDRPRPKRRDRPIEIAGAIAEPMAASVESR